MHSPISTGVQAGTNEAGRIEKVEVSLPKGVRLTSMPDKTLSGMIASGELDCVIIARPPNSFREKHPDVVRLFPEYEAIEQRYYEETRVYPIMHVIAMRKAILDGQPWVARNLYNAFEESKRRSLERILDPAVSRYPVPWLTNYAMRMQQMFAANFFPTESRQIGRRWNCSCATRTSKASRTDLPGRKKFSPLASWRR